jgi:hypothetical protein
MCFLLFLGLTCLSHMTIEEERNFICLLFCAFVSICVGIDEFQLRLSFLPSTPVGEYAVPFCSRELCLSSGV